MQGMNIDVSQVYPRIPYSLLEGLEDKAKQYKDLF